MSANLFYEPINLNNFNLFGKEEGQTGSFCAIKPAGSHGIARSYMDRAVGNLPSENEVERGKHGYQRKD